MHHDGKPAFTCYIYSSRSPGLWTGECPALRLVSQGTSKSRATEAIFDAIRLYFDDPGESRMPSDADSMLYKIPFSRLIEEGPRHAASSGSA